MENLQEAREMLDLLHSKIDDGEELLQIEQGIFDVLSWLLDDTDKPEIDY